MKSDGEKMPPDEPDPRLTDVANSFAGVEQQKEPGDGELPGQGCLNGRVTDALDIVVSAPTHERIDQHTDNQHAESMAKVTARHFVEQIL
jgi:hypothetical protein